MSEGSALSRSQSSPPWAGRYGARRRAHVAPGAPLTSDPLPRRPGLQHLRCRPAPCGSYVYRSRARLALTDAARRSRFGSESRGRQRSASAKTSTKNSSPHRRGDEQRGTNHTCVITSTPPADAFARSAPFGAPLLSRRLSHFRVETTRFEKSGRPSRCLFHPRRRRETG